MLGRTSLSRAAATSFTPDPDRESFNPGLNRQSCNEVPPPLRLDSGGRAPERKIGLSLLNSQHQHCTLHIQKDMIPYALCYLLCPVSAPGTVPRVIPGKCVSTACPLNGVYRGTSPMRERPSS